MATGLLQDYDRRRQSSDEDEKALEGDDFAERLLSFASQRARYHNVSVLSFIANVILCGIIVYLVLPLNPNHLNPTRTYRAAREIAGDVNDIWPRLPQKIIQFQPDDRYVGNLTSSTFIEDTKKYWLDLVPKGLGFVEVPSPERYPALSKPYMKYDKPVYTTSVTHQLHCLYMIMHGFNDLALNNGKFRMDMSEGDDGLTREGEDPSAHLSHCFDYLRQAIMCHGDTALEGLQTTFGPDIGGSDGWNVQHVCKPWDRIYGWLEDHRIDDREWI